MDHIIWSQVDSNIRNSKYLKDYSTKFEKKFGVFNPDSPLIPMFALLVLCLLQLLPYYIFSSLFLHASNHSLRYLSISRVFPTITDTEIKLKNKRRND